MKTGSITWRGLQLIMNIFELIKEMLGVGYTLPEIAERVSIEYEIIDPADYEVREL